MPEKGNGRNGNTSLTYKTLKQKQNDYCTSKGW